MSHVFTGSEVPAYHVTGCGGIAFYFLRHPDEGMPMTADLVVYPDGTQPPLDHETKAICGTCYEDLAVTDLTVRRPADWSLDLPPPRPSGKADGMARPY
jgi:hypothetical protein